MRSTTRRPRSSGTTTPRSTASVAGNQAGAAHTGYYAMKIHPLQFSGSSLLSALPPPSAGSGVKTPRALRGSVPASPRRSSGRSGGSVGAKKSGGRRGYTMDEVRKHDTEDSAWVVVEGKIYDATTFIDDHPGGVVAILLKAGEDASEEFIGTHSRKARGMLDRFYVGDLVDGGMGRSSSRR